MHTSYLNDGQCLTDKDFWKFIIMYTYANNTISCLGWNQKWEIHNKIKKSKKLKKSKKKKKKSKNQKNQKKIKKIKKIQKNQKK